MFPISTEPELEVGFLRSGRRFKSGKRKNTSVSLFEESDYKFE